MYAHVRDAFGDRAAFVFGWLLLLVAAVEIALVAQAAAFYLGELAGWPAEQAGLHAAAMIALGALISARDTRQAIGLARTVTLLVGAAILLIGIVLLARAAAGGESLAHPGPRSTDMGLPGLFVSAMWSMGGWHYAVLMAGESRDPDRALPAGLALGAGMVVGAYLLMALAYATLPAPEPMVLPAERVSEVFGLVLGPWGGVLAGALRVAALFILLTVTMLATSRVMLAMAEDGLFFRGLAVLHPLWQTPSRALWVLAVLSAAGALARLPDLTAASAAVLGWVLLGMAASTLFVYRRRFPVAERPFRAPGYPWTPLLFVAAGAAMVYEQGRTQPDAAVVAGGALLAAFFLHGPWMWRLRTAADWLRG